MLKKDLEIETELFTVANKLRGKIAPAEYKYYVLPLVFLRHLTLKYELRLKQIREEYPENDLVLEEREKYTEVDVFYVPLEARWDYLKSFIKTELIKEKIDTAMELLEKEHEKLKGVLPKIYANSNIPCDVISDLILLFSHEKFNNLEENTIDSLGRIYEYFIGNFASTEGNRGGEFFTPSPIVRLLVSMLEPIEGSVYDPACGTGGMFIQSHFYKDKKLKYFGQEQNALTIKLAKMNSILHGIYPDIKQGDTLLNDLFPDLKADYIITNPPFNMKDWGAEYISENDPRLIGGVNKNNANYMWIQHILHHLNDNGTAGFVIANGALTSNQSSDKEVRKFLIDNELIDCVVQLPDKMFFGTAIPSALIFISKSRRGNKNTRIRNEEILFLDTSNLGEFVSKKHKILKDEEISEISGIYKSFKEEEKDFLEVGFYKSVLNQEVINNDYKLIPSLYVGVPNDNLSVNDYENEISRLAIDLEKKFKHADKLSNLILKNLGEYL